MRYGIRLGVSSFCFRSSSSTSSVLPSLYCRGVSGATNIVNNYTSGGVGEQRTVAIPRSEDQCHNRQRQAATIPQPPTTTPAALRRTTLAATRTINSTLATPTHIYTALYESFQGLTSAPQKKNANRSSILQFLKAIKITLSQESRSFTKSLHADTLLEIISSRSSYSSPPILRRGASMVPGCFPSS